MKFQKSLKGMPEILAALIEGHCIQHEKWLRESYLFMRNGALVMRRGSDGDSEERFSVFDNLGSNGWSTVDPRPFNTVLRSDKHPAMKGDHLLILHRSKVELIQDKGRVSGSSTPYFYVLLNPTLMDELVNAPLNNPGEIDA